MVKLYNSYHKKILLTLEDKKVSIFQVLCYHKMLLLKNINYKNYHKNNNKNISQYLLILKKYYYNILLKDVSSKYKNKLIKNNNHQLM